MGFPTGHFLTVTSGPDISLSAPPFLAGIGQAGSLHKGWHRPPFVPLGSILSGLSSQDCSRSGTGTRNEPQKIRRQQQHFCGCFLFQFNSECLQNHGRPSHLVAFRCSAGQSPPGSLKKSPCPAHSLSEPGTNICSQLAERVLHTATLENQGPSPGFSDLWLKAPLRDLATI